MITFHFPGAGHDGQARQPQQPQQPPSLDVSNANGAALLHVLGQASAPCGTIAPDQLPLAITRLAHQLEALDAGRRSWLQREPRAERTALTPHGPAVYWIECGCSATAARHKVAALLAIVQWAAAHGLPVYWD